MRPSIASTSACVVVSVWDGIGVVVVTALVDERRILSKARVTQTVGHRKPEGDLRLRRGALLD